MKIAYLNQSYPPMISGAAIVVERLAHNMAARGHPALVIAASDKGFSYTTHEENMRVVRLASIPNPKRAYQHFTPGCNSRISSELKTFQPDVIHIHDILWMGVTGLLFGRKMNIPVIATIHQLPWFVSAYLPSIPGLKPLVKRILWRYSRWLNNQCVCMIVPTRTISQTIEAKGGYQTIVIGNGVNLNRFTPISTHSGEAERLCLRLRLSPEKPIILHLGRLDVDKRVDVVIRAAAKAMQQCDAQLLVVGDGEYRKKLIELANHLGIGTRSCFPGFMDPKQEVPSIFRMASVFTTASEIETQGLVLLEALASGLPVVAVDATCIPEIVKNNINGFLLQPRDVNAIAEKLVEILRDPSNARQMGTAGRLIAQDHSIKDSFDNHEDLYKSIVKAYQEGQYHNPVLSRGSSRWKIHSFYQSFLDQLGRNK